MRKVHRVLIEDDKHQISSKLEGQSKQEIRFDSPRRTLRLHSNKTGKIAHFLNPARTLLSFKNYFEIAFCLNYIFFSDVYYVFNPRPDSNLSLKSSFQILVSSSPVVTVRVTSSKKRAHHSQSFTTWASIKLL